MVKYIEVLGDLSLFRILASIANAKENNDDQVDLAYTLACPLISSYMDPGSAGGIYTKLCDKSEFIYQFRYSMDIDDIPNQRKIAYVTCVKIPNHMKI